eukprot:6039247-Amphidinium_carterae.1
MVREVVKLAADSKAENDRLFATLHRRPRSLRGRTWYCGGSSFRGPPTQMWAFWTKLPLASSWWGRHPGLTSSPRSLFPL